MGAGGGDIVMLFKQLGAGKQTVALKTLRIVSHFPGPGLSLSVCDWRYKEAIVVWLSPGSGAKCILEWMP